MMLIKPLTAEYLDDAEKIEKICFSIPWSRETLEKELDNPTARFFVALKDGRAVGYMGIHIILGEGDIMRVAVLPECRRLGAGKALLSECLKSDELDTVFLDVRENNMPAIRLYESFGFKNIGVRKNYYSNPTENAVEMKWENKSSNSQI
ncbi:MAG: ribosomal protein S18-alanine N-acetyltransferase [Eubacterium sp.]